jgi:PDZ domain-containing protein
MRHLAFFEISVVSGSLIIALLASSKSFAADTSEPTVAPSFASQADDAGTPRLPAQQPGGSTTLEVAPQPSSAENPPGRSETPEERAFRKSEDVAALNRNFHPQGDADHVHSPYLGITVEYSTQCFLGAEEHGFEVMNVYPDSPAARAGLQARTSSTPIGDLQALGSILLFPVSLYTIPRLRRSGALGEPGDLIIAVDDRRVRSEGEFKTALSHLKPGDTTYLTVIRPTPGGSHQTIRVAMHIDREVDASGNPYALSSEACRENHKKCWPEPDPMLRKPFDAPAKDNPHSPSTESAAN